MDDDAPTPRLIEATGLLAQRFGLLGGGFGRVMRAWRRAAGDTWAKHAFPTSLRDGILRVNCSSASWANDLQFAVPELLERLRAELGDAAPRSIRFYTGRVPAEAPQHLPGDPLDAHPNPAPLADLDPNESAAIQHLADRLESGAVHDSVARAMEAAARRRKAAD